MACGYLHVLFASLVVHVAHGYNAINDPRYEALGLCEIFTVVESPIYLSTFIASNTIIALPGCTILDIQNAPTELVTIITTTTTLGGSLSIPTRFGIDADAQSANPSTSPPSTATAKPTCLMANLPGSTPTSIGNANLVGIPGPAAYPIRGNMLAFSFGGNISVGAIGRTSLNSGSPITDELAFYHSKIDSQAAYQLCDGFGLGYLYHVTSGLCITGQVTSNMSPKFEDSELHLDYCDTCSEVPVQAQLFCARRIVLGDIGAFYSMAFVGDSDTGEQYYGIGDFDEGTEIALLELMHSRGIYLSWD